VLVGGEIKCWLEVRSDVLYMAPSNIASSW
jgi:hypothetical protein